MAGRTDQGSEPRGARTALKSLIFLMFAMFAMTTDSVGTVIPQVIAEFHLGLTAGGAFQYATMSGIGLSALGLGFLADRLGRKATILIGLAMFGVSSALFAAGHSFLLFVALLFVSGLGIGIFKAGALALVGDLTTSTHEHARIMNLIEGFFGVGAIIGPAVVTVMVQHQASWKWVYLLAAALCAMLIAGATVVRFPRPRIIAAEQARAQDSLKMIGDPAVLSFGAALMLYVGAEAAVYVWAPTYLESYQGSWVTIAGYAVAIFFALRAAGRFLGVWLLARLDWGRVVALCSTAMALLFWIAVAGGREAGVFALPLTGLFMSVLYPTLNSTGISCHPKSRHGSVAGLLLFFTCVSAVLAPLAMGAIGEWLGDISFSIVVGSVLATGLAVMAIANVLLRPFDARLNARNLDDYQAIDIA